MAICKKFDVTTIRQKLLKILLWSKRLTPLSGCNINMNNLQEKLQDARWAAESFQFTNFQQRYTFFSQWITILQNNRKTAKMIFLLILSFFEKSSRRTWVCWTAFGFVENCKLKTTKPYKTNKSISQNSW